jgi:hypothetical protein
MAPHRSSPVALDVTVRWRDDIIACRHLAGGDGSLSVGDRPGAIAFIPCGPEGGFVFARVSGGAAAVRVPGGEIAGVRRADGGFEIAFGPCEVAVSSGDSVALPLGDFHLTASAGAPERLPRGGRRRGAGVVGALALAALAHAAAFGLAAQSAMASSLDVDESDRAAELRGLMASAELRARSAAERPIDDGSGKLDGREENGKSGDGRKGGGARAAGDEGKMGDRLGRGAERRRYAVEAGAKNDPAPAPSRAEAIADASAFGMIGLLAQGTTAPSAWFGDAEAHGVDALAARGALWARLPGESGGEAGLGLSNTGEGGGGKGEGIGLGAIGALGHTDGLPGAGLGGAGSPSSGWGRGHWGLRGGHRVKPPRIYWGSYTSVSGRLPPEIIQRIVRLNFGRFRACYENGLRNDPNLMGRVAVRFVIGRDGAVSSVSDGGSDLPDREVVSCVVRAFYGLSFPQPEFGIVTVTYPIVFAPL